MEGFETIVAEIDTYQNELDQNKLCCSENTLKARILMQTKWNVAGNTLKAIFPMQDLWHIASHSPSYQNELFCSENTLEATFPMQTEWNVAPFGFVSIRIIRFGKQIASKISDARPLTYCSPFSFISKRIMLFGKHIESKMSDANRMKCCSLFSFILCGRLNWTCYREQCKNGYRWIPFSCEVMNCNNSSTKMT